MELIQTSRRTRTTKQYPTRNISRMETTKGIREINGADPNYGTGKEWSILLVLQRGFGQLYKRETGSWLVVSTSEYDVSRLLVNNGTNKKTVIAVIACMAFGRVVASFHSRQGWQFSFPISDVASTKLGGCRNIHPRNLGQLSNDCRRVIGIRVDTGTLVIFVDNVVGRNTLRCEKAHTL